MARVAIYTRLSRDLTGEQTSTGRQERLCRQYAEARGWQVCDVFEDVDISAYSGVARPAFEALRRAADAGAYEGVLVWKLDRLVRRPSDFERFWAVCEYRKVFLASVTEPIDSSTELGVAIVRLLVTFAGLESSTKSIRQRAREREAAQAGRPHIGRPSFGWTGVYEAFDPAQAGMIREAADRVLNGESLSTIAVVLNERGVSSPTGVLWSAGSIRNVLRKQTLTGDRAYHGEVLARDCWPAILDRDTFARVQLALADRARPSARHDRYLLTGLLVCGDCGSRMTGAKRSKATGATRAYHCPRPPYGCNCVTIVAAPLEEWVLAECARRDATPTASPEELLAAANALRELARDFYSGHLISRDEYHAARAELARHEPAIYTDLPDHDNPISTRAYVANRLAAATVSSGWMGKRFEPQRITATWRTTPIRPLVRKQTPARNAQRPDNHEWLTADQARHILGDISPTAFQRLTIDGTLRRGRAGPTGYRRAAVEAVLEHLRYRPAAVHIEGCL